MSWWKKKKLVPNDHRALALLRFAGDFVTDAIRDMDTHHGIQQQSEAERMRLTSELMHFCFFALDYWISNHAAAQQERQGIRESLCYHWQEMLGDDVDGQIMWEASQRRLHEYAEIVNEAQAGDADKVLGFGIKLTECSGCPKHPLLLALIPSLFYGAMDAVNVELREKE